MVSVRLPLLLLLALPTSVQSLLPTARLVRTAPHARCIVVRCAAVQPVGPRLMLVDEQESMRQAVQRYFSQRGFRCESFASGEAALEAMARSPPPDVLITEVMTSSGDSLDGLDLLRAVRADARLCGTPVVLLTSRGLTADRIAGYSAGASAYVSKPFDPEELVAVVRSLAQNAMLARGSLVSSEVHALRAEVASMRQLLQAVLVSGGAARAAYTPGDAQREGPPPVLPSAATGGAGAGSGGAKRGAAAPPLGDYPAAAGTTPWQLVDVPKLTRREMSVLELVGDGKLNKEIAAQVSEGVGRMRLRWPRVHSCGHVYTPVARLLRVRLAATAGPPGCH